MIFNIPIGIYANIPNYEDVVVCLTEEEFNNLETKDINNIWNNISKFNYYFTKWSNMDKNRTIETLIISYYFRSEHLNKIYLDDKINDNNQKNEMIQELEEQRKNIIKTILLIDKSFDINFLEKNYSDIYKSIQKSWNEITISITNNMKKAYYDMLCKDLLEGNIMSCFNIIKEIGNRIAILCSNNDNILVEIKKKFIDDNIINLLQNNNFTSEINNFILFIVDLLLLLDAPINDNDNKLWKDDIIKIINGNNNYYDNFPKILIQIEEHIDSIYKLIIELNPKNN